MHCALVGKHGLGIASHAMQKVALAVRPPGLIPLSILDQLIELEGLGKPSSLECLAELGTKIDGLALASTHLFVSG
jgi:hypothetical protein